MSGVRHPFLLLVTCPRCLPKSLRTRCACCVSLFAFLSAMGGLLHGPLGRQVNCERFLPTLMMPLDGRKLLFARAEFNVSSVCFGAVFVSCFKKASSLKVTEPFSHASPRSSARLALRLPCTIRPKSSLCGAAQARGLVSFHMLVQMVQHHFLIILSFPCCIAGVYYSERN